MAVAKPLNPISSDARRAGTMGVLAPGVWLMRRLRLGGKFGLLAGAVGLVLAGAAFAPPVTEAPGWVGALLFAGF